MNPDPNLDPDPGHEDYLRFTIVLTQRIFKFFFSLIFMQQLFKPFRGKLRTFIVFFSDLFLRAKGFKKNV